MNTRTFDGDYQTEDGRTTHYQATVYSQDGQNPIVLMQDAPHNEGQRFGQNKTGLDQATLHVASVLDKEGITPANQEIYQRIDGQQGLDKVTFEPAEVNGDLVWKEQRENISGQDFAERLGEIENIQSAPEEAKNFDLEKESMPQINREVLSKEELKEFEEKVEQDNQKEANEQEISQVEEIKREQGISR